MTEIIVSTGDIQQDYEVLRPIHLFHFSNFNKVVFGTDEISVNETIAKMIDKLREEAEDAGGDAITFLRVDWQHIQLGGKEYLVYGTLVKFK